MKILEADEILPAPDGAAPADTGGKFLSQEEIKKLVTDNMKLAYYFANKYSNIPGIDKDEVVGQAMAGLVKAANMYNPAKGNFSHYASTAIRAHMNHLFFHATEKETHEQTTLDAPAYGDEGETETQKDLIGAEKDRPGDYMAARQEAANIIKKAMEELDPTEREILTRWMGQESYRDMQKDFGISFVQIGNIARNALRKIKEKLSGMGIKEISDILPESLLDSNGKAIYEQLVTEIALHQSIKNISEELQTSLGISKIEQEIQILIETVLAEAGISKDAYKFDNGLVAVNNKDADQIIKALNESGQFDKTYFDKQYNKIRFDLFATPKYCSSFV